MWKRPWKRMTTLCRGNEDEVIEVKYNCESEVDNKCDFESAISFVLTVKVEGRWTVSVPLVTGSESDG